MYKTSTCLVAYVLLKHPPLSMHYHGVIGLNAVRVLSVVGLILLLELHAVNRFQANRIANSTDDMLDCDYIEGSTVNPAGVFWAVVASLLSFSKLFFVRPRFFLRRPRLTVPTVSELSWPMVFFDRSFLALGALGIFQALIGAQILSYHVNEERPSGPYAAT
ncbi:hypothetical protein GGX14DRAFT_656697 [Mycena pura]|uniref:Uncharacterized protein n=1 Tax=Mycena pura TaxID=153505 RepID=A0AAD6V6V1_9AGAR|nr:hypothetical protein GGX14DRAFT_656697 [Mycena pura]